MRARTHSLRRSSRAACGFGSEAKGSHRAGSREVESAGVWGGERRGGTGKGYKPVKRGGKKQRQGQHRYPPEPRVTSAKEGESDDTKVRERQHREPDLHRDS